ncbi:unnamed protein product [Tetraodon nigroviridis]|uniref:Protein-S-isoprenylcysteine O-methyltransferase n=1 Tax=Tetraodon nigroviridis TaxID=99883 RepID=Q4T319_TETNG|nr:unnamed protein product [Tetraodon nigroviridis]
MAGKLVLEGRVSLNAFLLGLSVLAVPLIRTCFGHLDWVYDYLTETPGKAAVCAHTQMVNRPAAAAVPRAAVPASAEPRLGEVAVRACFLGVTFGCGLIISFSESTWTHFGWYMCSLSFFHYSEYLVTAIINPHSLSLDSFLLNHSVEYTLAALSSWVEFTVEKLTVPGRPASCLTLDLGPELKQLRWVSLLGLLMVLGGDSLRKAAMLTAGSNFNHIVQNEKARSHVLVTSGVYSLFRHPSYVGWFYWSAGTQVRRRSSSLLSSSSSWTSANAAAVAGAAVQPGVHPRLHRRHLALLPGAHRGGGALPHPLLCRGLCGVQEEGPHGAALHLRRPGQLAPRRRTLAGRREAPGTRWLHAVRSAAEHLLPSRDGDGGDDPVEEDAAAPPAFPRLQVSCMFLAS